MASRSETGPCGGPRPDGCAAERDLQCFGRSWYRAKDAIDPRAINKGVSVYVQEGSQAGYVYRFNTLLPNLGADAISIVLWMTPTSLADMEQAVTDAEAAKIAAEAARGSRSEIAVQRHPVSKGVSRLSGQSMASAWTWC